MINKKMILACLIFTFPVMLFAQVNQAKQYEVVIKNSKGEGVFSFPEDTPDQDIKKIPQKITAKRLNDVPEFIRLLAEYINKNSSNDYERLKKAHDWVALNIKYDVDSYFSGRYSSQDFNAVIKRGYAVCAGYADVFKYVCDALEIECEIVSGYARGYSSGLFKNANVMNTNHAWNIVTIEGEKYLIDSTWDAGYVNGRKYAAKYRTDYFLTDPSIFIYNHFSYSASEQLLDPPLNAEEFDDLPFLRPEFFKVFETWPEFKKINEVSIDNEVTLEFTLKEGYELCYGWYTASGTQSGSYFYPERMDVYKIKVPKLKPGKYFLRLSIKKPEERLYWGCGDIGFSVKN